MQSFVIFCRKALALTPDLVASTVITWMVGMVLPEWLAWPLFVAGPVLLLILLFGGLEALAVRVLRGGRPVAPDEAVAIAPALELLRRHGGIPPDFRLYVITGSTGWDAWGSGRRSILMTEDLLWATSRGVLDDRVVAAFVAHAVGRVRHGLTRNDLAIDFWSLPLALIRGVLGMLLANVATQPMVAFSWRARVVLGSAAVTQTAMAGHYPMAVVIAAIVLVSYLVPWWQRQWAMLGERLADQYVRANGLGIDLGTALTLLSRAPETMRRVQRLTRDSTVPTGGTQS